MSSVFRTLTAHQTCWVREQLIIIGQSLWYSPDYDSGEKGMVEYCTTTDQIKQIIKYPIQNMHAKLQNHSLCQCNGNIYIVNNRSEQIYSFNPKTAQFSQAIQIPNIGANPSCISINNHIHIFHGETNRKHLFYSIKENKIQALNDPIATVNMTGVAILKYKDRIIRFGGKNWDSKEHLDFFAMSSQIHDNNLGYIEWYKKVEYKLPLSVYRFGYVLYKHYIIIFGGMKNNGEYTDSIYLLDLDKNIGWIPLNGVICPLKSSYRAAIDSANNIHLYTGVNHKEWRKSTRRHYSIPISTILREIHGLSEEKKCAECDVFRQHLNVIKTEKISLQKQLQQVIDTLKSNQQRTDMENKDLKEENDQLKLNQQRAETSQKDLNVQINEFKHQINTLQKDNCDLNEECKEIKLELITTKEELQKLKAVNNLDLNNYQNWTSDEFVDWIVSLENGKYRKYEQKLRTAFKKEEVDGSVIGHIDKTEWKDWGITIFKDRMNLDKHMKSLVNKNKSNVYRNENEGIGGTQYI